jgi:ornithine cyclodeaminase/alanine dehydrogenase-like protein (mu-crystallin family)
VVLHDARTVTAGSAAEAVAGRDPVILATTAPTRVIAADLAPGAHVNAVGFTQHGRAELGLDLRARGTEVSSWTGWRRPHRPSGARR